MLIAIAIAAAVAANPGDVARKPPAPDGAPIPPLTIRVYPDPRLPESLVTRTLTETSAIWRALGFSFVWQIGSRALVPFTDADEAGAFTRASLSVVIGEQHGVVADGNTPLGWIVFDHGGPMSQVYVSEFNALSLLGQLEGRRMDTMVPREKEDLLSRAMGRALAHEIGHYLLASKEHTRRGLMKATRSAAEFFSMQRSQFDLDVDQRLIVARGVRREALLTRQARIAAGHP